MFRCIALSRKVSHQSKTVTRNFCDDIDKDVTGMYGTVKDVTFFMQLFGLSNHATCKILEANKLLCDGDKDDIKRSMTKLRNLKYTVEDVRERPMALLQNALTLDNRFRVFVETGFNRIPLNILVRYVTVINKQIYLLKAHGLIPYELDIAARLAHYLPGLEGEKDSNYDETIQLTELRKALLNKYLRDKLQMSQIDIDKIWKIYPRLKHRSFTSVNKSIEILQNQLGFDMQRIINNGYLLHADPNNMSNIITKVVTIGGIDIREIANGRPKILMTNCDTILKILEYLKAFNIPETALLRSPEILTLGPNTVLERLTELQRIKEFDVLIAHPRILRLVHYQNKARIRLEYLQQIKLKCASLHVLSSNSENFERFAREGADKTKGRDVVVYLAKALMEKQTVVRDTLSRHPNWCHVPLVSIKQIFDYLRMQNYSVHDILNHVHLLFYPLKRVEEQMALLMRPQSTLLEDRGIDRSQLDNGQILGLCLYFIELEFHFTGDGIWADPTPHCDASFTTPNPELPKTLNKQYKYGVKPSANYLVQNAIN